MAGRLNRHPEIKWYAKEMNDEADYVVRNVAHSIAAFHTSAVFAAGMQDDVNQAATIIQRFQTMPEGSIPAAVLKDAKGLAILTVIKAGIYL